MNLLGIPLDHAVIMEWVEAFWEFLNINGIAEALLNLGCGVVTWKIVKAFVEFLNAND